MFILFKDTEKNSFKKYIRGTEITCKNQKCKKKSAKINCPFCYSNEILPNKVSSNKFPNNITCSNLKCNKKFHHYYCPSCKTSKIQKGEKKQDLYLLSCPKNKEKTHVKNLCKNFNFLNCPSCSKIFYYLESDINSNINLFQCPISNCAKIFSIDELGESKILSNFSEINKNDIIKGKTDKIIDADFLVNLSEFFEFNLIENEEAFIEELSLNDIFKVPFINQKKKVNEKDECEEGTLFNSYF